MRLTDRELAAAYTALSRSSAKLAAHHEAIALAATEPPWLTTARQEIGTKEVPGAGDNERIREYHSVTAAGAAPDSVPWCASFVCWCLQQAGLPHTRSKAARSFLMYGIKLEAPKPGCIVVLSRGKYPSAHVGFWTAPLQVLGGNQRNAVNIKAFKDADVLEYRWPEAR